MLTASEKYRYRIDPHANEEVKIAEDESCQVSQVGDSATGSDNQGNNFYSREYQNRNPGRQWYEKVDENSSIRKKCGESKHHSEDRS